VFGGPGIAQLDDDEAAEPGPCGGARVGVVLSPWGGLANAEPQSGGLGPMSSGAAEAAAEPCGLEWLIELVTSGATEAPDGSRVQSTQGLATPGCW
jgi:hypothetical protein